MALAESLVKLLTDEEGLRLTVYDDATGKPITPGSTVIGHPTIGIGRALDTNGISNEEARALLLNDLAKITGQLDQRLPWWRRLSQNRQMVLAAMAFQLGMAGLLGFSNTLKLIEAGRYAEASSAMMQSLWARQTPARAARMARLMKDG